MSAPPCCSWSFQHPEVEKPRAVKTTDLMAAAGAALAADGAKRKAKKGSKR